MSEPFELSITDRDDEQRTVRVWIGHAIFDDDDDYPTFDLSLMVEEFVRDNSTDTHYDADAVGRLRLAVNDGIARAIEGKLPDGKN